jgi:hypothetical protein
VPLRRVWSNPLCRLEPSAHHKNSQNQVLSSQRPYELYCTSRRCQNPHPVGVVVLDIHLSVVMNIVTCPFQVLVYGKLADRPRQVQLFLHQEEIFLRPRSFIEIISWLLWSAGSTSRSLSCGTPPPSMDVQNENYQAESIADVQCSKFT